MSNYTDNNLIVTTAPNNARAIKIGNKIFTGFYDAPVSPINFYKCASVDTSNSTWTGRLATVSNSTGMWYFSSDSTSLVYDRITPVVGGVYDEACSFEVKNYKTVLPSDYIFYLPLNADPGNTDETGKTLTFENKSNITFGLSVQGITCARFTNTAVIGGPDFASIIPNDASAKFTASCWACVYQNDLNTSFGFNPEITYSTTYLSGVCMNRYNWRIYKGDGSSPFSSYSGTGFRHVLVTFGDNTCKMYVDGSFIGQASYSVTDKPFGNNTVWRPYIGTANSGDSAYLAAFRVYDRVVTSDEIALLAAEFTPTVS